MSDRAGHLAPGTGHRDITVGNRQPATGNRSLAAGVDVSPLPFHRRATQAIADASLQIALDRATGRMVDARRTAFGAMPDGDVTRDHVRRIRAHTLANLGRYLDQFVGAATAAGAHVHFAADAAAATRLVVDLARAHDVQRVVKGKSMVSEEVLLNHALEAEGMRVVETDLGEYVVQLDRDVPSHIIAPIIHKTREQVAETFRRELHATDAEVADIPEMTAFARRMLRAEFLAADMGVSGVNFAVAETGSLCLIENEGNGRLSTTAPRLHVALLGLERIVPTTADLTQALRLLARSATGQPLTVYTNVITGPRRAGDPDGPSDLHVVIVDNGRSRLLRTELEEILYCIRCGACLNVCPVYQEIGGHAYGSVYQGPVGAVYTPGAFGLDPWAELPQASSLCGACKDACPVRIDIPRMLLALRADAETGGHTPRWVGDGLHVFRVLATHPRLFRLASAAARRVSNWLGPTGFDRLPGPLAGWTRHRHFPPMARETFTERHRRAPGTGHRAPDSAERQPATGNRQPDSAERQPPTGNRQLDSAERQPPTGNRQSDSAERQPPTGNRQPDSAERAMEQSSHQPHLTAGPALRARPTHVVDLFPRSLREKLDTRGAEVAHPGAFGQEAPTLDVDEAIARFTTACEAVGGRVSRVASTDEAAAVVLDYLTAPEWRRDGCEDAAPFVSWDAAHLPLPDLPALLDARGAPRLDAYVNADQSTRLTDYARLDAAIVGVTGADAALVDTGSVVLLHGEGRGRLVSLLPPIHVVLVRVDRLRATLAEMIAAAPLLPRDSTNVVVVTGPSRTADIEMSLTRGVHGPRLVHVVFVG
ncbi:MAG: iron-sulfur cluster-binding protein [Acidobacteria bacterium]|nr:iron-sulfur cluster-binding protein [Acidobacteriota bacterium]